MRIAIVSDIHGNRSALEAVIRDLREVSPDLVMHGGDLADAGSSPVEVVDRIRELGWPGVRGNTDEMLAEPESLERFAAGLPVTLEPMWAALREIAADARADLGEERLTWLGGLPEQRDAAGIRLLHGRPGDAWRAPRADAAEEEFEAAYGEVREATIVYGHIHVPIVRRVGARVVVNAGSVGLPYDGDARASYVLIDDGVAMIRRVEYDVDEELAVLAESGRPHADWVARTIRAASPQMF